MKDISVSREVTEEVHGLIKQLHQICIKNNLPVVAATVVYRKTTPEGQCITKPLATYLNGDTGAVDSTIAAAFEILQMREVPRPVIELLIKMNASTRESGRGPVVGSLYDVMH